jgi:hypothetical protein
MVLSALPLKTAVFWVEHFVVWQMFIVIPLKHAYQASWCHVPKYIDL